MPTAKLQTILHEIEMARSIREIDEDKYDQLLEMAKEQLLELSTLYPDNAKVSYECAAVHDMLGHEKEAVPYYERAIASDTLSSDDLRGAFLGLGSTYRCIGEYEKSITLLTKALSLFPEDHSLRVFLALAKYNGKDFEGAIQLLLDSLVETSSSRSIQQYSRAIRYYRDRLDQVW